MANLTLPENNGDNPNLTVPTNNPYQIGLISGISLKIPRVGDVSTEKFNTRIKVQFNNSTTDPNYTDLFIDANNNFDIVTYTTNNKQLNPPVQYKDVGISSYLTNDFKILSVLNYPAPTNKLRYFNIVMVGEDLPLYTQPYKLIYKVISMAPNSQSKTGSYDYVAKLDIYQTFIEQVETTLNEDNNLFINPERTTAYINPYIMENYSTGEYEAQKDNNDIIEKINPTQYVQNRYIEPVKQNVTTRDVFASSKYIVNTTNTGTTLQNGVLRLIAGVPINRTLNTKNITQDDRDNVTRLKPIVLYPAPGATQWNKGITSKIGYVTPQNWQTKITNFFTSVNGDNLLNNNYQTLIQDPLIPYKSTMKCMVAIINNKFYAFPLGTFIMELSYSGTGISTVIEEYAVFNDPLEIEDMLTKSNIKNIVFKISNGVNISSMITSTGGKQFLASTPNTPVQLWEKLSFNVLQDGFLGYYDLPIDFNSDFAPLTFGSDTTPYTSTYKSIIGYELSPNALTKLSTNNITLPQKSEIFNRSEVTYNIDTYNIDQIISSRSGAPYTYNNSLFNYHTGVTFSNLHIPQHLLNQVNPIFIDRIYLTMYNNYNNELKFLAPVERAVQTNYDKLQAQIANQINYDNSVNNLIQQQNLSKRSIALSKQQADYSHTMGIVSATAGAVTGIAGAFGKAASGNLFGAVGGSVKSLFDLGVNIANNEQAYHVANIQRGIAEDTLKNQMAENQRNNETNKRLITLNNKYTPVTQVEESVKHLTNPYLYNNDSSNKYKFGWLAQYKKNDAAKYTYFMYRLNYGFDTMGYNIPNFTFKQYQGNISPEDNPPQLTHYYLNNEFWDYYLPKIFNYNDRIIKFLIDDIYDFCKNGWASGTKLWWQINQINSFTFE